jgi:hypothetical protein
LDAEGVRRLISGLWCCGWEWCRCWLKEGEAQFEEGEAGLGPRCWLNMGSVCSMWPHSYWFKPRAIYQLPNWTIGGGSSCSRMSLGICLSLPANLILGRLLCMEGRWPSASNLIWETMERSSSFPIGPAKFLRSALRCLIWLSDPSLN